MTSLFESTRVPSGRRIACIALPRIRLEVGRESMLRTKGKEDARDDETSAPLAIVIARPGSTIKDETSLLGNTRLDEVSVEAFAEGIRRGETIASARAKIAHLRVRVVHADSVRAVMERICEALLAFGATTSFDDGESDVKDSEMRTPKRDVVWVDITGCAHLYEHDARQGDPAGGERVLASRLAQHVRAMGHACSVAVADGAYIAAAVAWYASHATKSDTTHAEPQRANDTRVFVVPPGANARAMRGLSLNALPLTEETRRWLGKSGLRVAGDLQRLPRASLGVRLGAVTARVMALLDGLDPTPIKPYVPPDVPEERADFEYGVESTEALVFVAKTLADRMATRLAGRVMAATRLELVLRLDRAFASTRAVCTYSIVLPAPVYDAKVMLNILRARLESLVVCVESDHDGGAIAATDASASPDVVNAPVLAMAVRAMELVEKHGTALDLFVREAKAERALPRLVSELAFELGTSRVGVLMLGNRWVLEERSRLVPITHEKQSLKQPKCSLMTSTEEPSRLLASPRLLDAPVPVASIRALLFRIEAAEWWTRGPSLRDVVAAWREDDRAMACVEIDRKTGATWLRGWLD